MYQGLSYLSEVGARGLLNLGTYRLSHQIVKTRFGLIQLDLHFKLSDFKTIINISVIALTLNTVYVVPCAMFLKIRSQSLFLFFVALRPKSTAMAIAGRSVHLTTLFSWASLNKQLTSNRAHTFACN